MTSRVDRLCSPPFPSDRYTQSAEPVTGRPMVVETYLPPGRLFFADSHQVKALVVLEYHAL